MRAQCPPLITGCQVKDLDHPIDGGKFAVTGIHCERDGKAQTIVVNNGDLVFLQNGSMTDASNYQHVHAAPGD